MITENSFKLDEARRTQDLSIADNKQRDSVFNIYIRDLTNADLNGIELGRICMKNLSVSGTSMSNASFINTDLRQAMFLSNTSYSCSIVANCDFDLTQSIIDGEQLQLS